MASVAAAEAAGVTCNRCVLECPGPSPDGVRGTEATACSSRHRSVQIQESFALTGATNQLLAEVGCEAASKRCCLLELTDVAQLS
jgi:hypothetical protein